MNYPQNVEYDWFQAGSFHASTEVGARLGNKLRYLTIVWWPGLGGLFGVYSLE